MHRKTPLLALLPLAATALAQEAEQTVTVLSPFEITAERDYGYVATTSLAGGRLATELRNTPSQISVLTREFLNDIGANNYLDALDWAPNAVNETAAGIATRGNTYFNENAANFRGLGGTFQTRDYFRWYVNSDSFSTERIDFARGPNSIVYGDSGVGGTANISSKQAGPNPITELQTRVNSFGGYRGTFDFNRPLGKQAAIRAGLLWDESDDWQDNARNERHGIFLAGLYRPAENTTIRVNAEAGEITRTIAPFLGERLGFWNGTTVVNGPVTSNPGGGVLRIANERLIVNNGLPGIGILDYRNYGETNGTGRMMLTDEMVFTPGPRTTLDSMKYNLQAPSGVESVQDYQTIVGSVQQKVGDNLYLELAGNYTYSERNIDRIFFDQLRIDVNRVLPNGTENPYFGKLYAEQPRIFGTMQSNSTWEARLSAAYLLDTELTKQRFLVAGGRRSDLFRNETHELVRYGGTNRSVLAATNRIAVRRYEGDESIGFTRPADGTVVPGGVLKTAWTEANDSDKVITYAQAAASGEWFRNGILSTLVGVRHDIVTDDAASNGVRLIDPVTQEVLGYGPRSRVTDQKVTTKTAGAVVHVLPQVSLFANYAESFEPTSTAFGVDGNSLPPLESEGQDIGLRVNFLDGKVLASAAYYQNEQANRRIGGLSGTINTIWSNIGSDRTVTNYNDTEAFEGSGFEFEVNLMPVRNLRITANIAFPETSIESGRGETRSYLASNLGDMQTGAAAISDAALRQSTQLAIQSLVDAVETYQNGRTLNGTHEYTANLFANYFFLEGPMKGLNLGGGVNFRGRRLVTNLPGNAFNYVYSDGYELVSLTAGYKTKLFKVPAHFQLNVSNALNRNIIRPITYGNATSAVQSGTQFVPSAYAVIAPRRFQATVTFQF